ncbi:MAG: hypothetical protein ACR2O0_16130 [Rhizobiaceae bacterium]
MARFDSTGTEYAGMACPENVENIFEMGLMYASGRNGEQDLVAAHKWFNIAAFRGFEPAKIQRAELSSEMTREQIAAAQRAARDWLSSH